MIRNDSAANEIIVYSGDFLHGRKGDPMIRDAALEWAEDAGFGADFKIKIKNTEIFRDNNGRPAFAGLPFDFSLSHSGNAWACLFSTGRCGFDLQHFRKKRTKDIAERFFPPNEKKHALESAANFFEVWTVREAMGKFTGKGVLDTLPDISDFSGLAEGGIRIGLGRGEVTVASLQMKDFEPFGIIQEEQEYPLEPQFASAYCISEGSAPLIRCFK